MNDGTIKQSTDSLSSSDLAKISIGQLFNERYKILDILGEGGMGIAYKALDIKHNKLVALKVLLPYRLPNAKDTTRFAREAKTASRLSHPGIAKVFDFAVLENDQQYLVMEYLDGKTLAQHIETKGQLPVGETLDIFIQICDALAYAHTNGILHRDIKPSNIMVLRDGNSLHAKLLDFGIAKPITPAELTYQQMTETGELVGSPLYMSPEQARNAILDGRSDLYSLGSTLYEALTGGPPHQGQTSIATLLKRETDQPMPMSEASLGRHFSSRLEQLVSKLLKTNPDDRFQSAGEVMQELISIKSDGSPDNKIDKHKHSSPVVQTTKALPSHIIAYAFTFLGMAVLLSLSVHSLIFPEKHRPNLAAKAQIETATPSSSGQTGLAYFDRYGGTESLLFAKGYMNKHNTTAALVAYQAAADSFEHEQPLPQSKYGLALTNIAYCYQLKGQFSDSADYLKRGLKAFQEAYGEISPEFAFSLSFAGSTFLQQQSVNANRAFETAKPLYARSLSIQEKVHDPYSIRLNCLLDQQGIACLSRNFVKEARWRFEKAHNISHSAPPELIDKFSFVTTLSSLADIYCRARECDRVPILCSEMLSRYLKFSVLEKRKYADYLRKIANALRLNGGITKDPIDSFQQAERAYVALLNVYANSPDTTIDTMATIYEDLGSTYSKEAQYGNRNRFELADRWLNRALNARQTMPKLDVPTIARIYCKLGNVASCQQRYDQASSLIERAIQLFEKSKGRNSIEFAEALGYSANLNRNQGQTAKAELSYLEVLKICKTTGKTNNNVEAGAFTGLGFCRRDLGHLAEAVAPLKQAHKFYMTKVGPSCPNLIAINKALEEIQQQLKQSKSIVGPVSIHP